MKFTQEQIAKAKEAKSIEELVALAQESGIAMTQEEATKYFTELNKNGELTDEELGAVAGGKGNSGLKEINISSANPCCPACGENLFKVVNSNSRPVTYTDEKGEYNLYGCTKCKERYRHHWSGDLWTKD